MNWREYQQQAADLFSSLGCTADIEKVVIGARGKHKIDVWVTRYVYGLDHHWVVECKYWNKRVTKDQVIVLKGIVDDVGADRGILLSSSGFQSGAISISERSNITLSSLDDLRESVRDELSRYTIASLEEKLANVSDGLYALLTEISRKDGRTSIRIRYIPGVTGQAAMDAVAKLSVLEWSFRHIKIGKKSFPISFKDDGKILERTSDISKFFEFASKIITECEDTLIQITKLKQND